MLKKLTHILAYHNIVPIGFMALFLSFGITLAASPDARGSIVSKNISARSVDNSYILSKDLEAFNPQLGIISIQEDESFYYVSYFYNTISIQDYVWKEGVIENTLSVSKQALGGGDLGEYVAKELREVLDSKYSYLKEVQKIERQNGLSNKVVSTTYSGLIGKFIKSSEEEFEGYVSVVKKDDKIVLTSAELERREQEAAGIAVQKEVDAQVSEQVAAVAAASVSRQEVERIIEARISELLAQSATQTTPSAEISTTNTNLDIASPTDTTPPTLTINGNNPAEIEIGVSYSDMGVVVTDNVDENLGYRVFVDGVLVPSISLDTSTTTTYTIEYNAIDNVGNTATTTREVIVGNATEEIISDTNPPTITLIGSSTVELLLGDTYIDEGAAAFDSFEGDITSAIVAVNQVDTSAVGTYTITYNVTDTAGNQAAQITRAIIVSAILDTTPPVITLVGSSTVSVLLNDTYTDLGATALDDTDGDITANIIINNPVNTSATSTYTVTYDVADDSGNQAARVSRAVIVE